LSTFRISNLSLTAEHENDVERVGSVHHRMPGITLFRVHVLQTKPLVGRLGLSQRLAPVRIIRIKFKNTQVTPTGSRFAGGTDTRPILLNGIVNPNVDWEAAWPSVDMRSPQYMSIEDGFMIPPDVAHELTRLIAPNA
jgi:hypothetical protein